MGLETSKAQTKAITISVHVHLAAATLPVLVHHDQMGIPTPKANTKATGNQPSLANREGGGVAGAAGGGGGSGAGGGGGGGAGAPGNLLPEGVPAKGVCSPRKETRDDLHT